ncbi:restriction endonuclease subunit S [Clostridium transplantifaecale]|uniref:restriction endonuclease subunit S n=1 Tax=Clostridium transplantifaecale TaxID=2479838 RepID=UPI000F62F4E6|nr:restriction endonuclease subunit S [Clostridium transplantifaecale]
MAVNVKLFKLEQVAKIYSGTNSKNGKTVFGEGGCPWVRVEDLNGTYVQTTTRSLTREGMEAMRISPPQTVFFSGTGTIGKVGISDKPMAPSNNIIAVEFDTQKVLPLYGMYCLAAMQNEFKAESRGSVYDSLRLTVFRKFKIPVPDMRFQKMVAGKLEALHQSETQQKCLEEALKGAVCSIFDKYFHEEVNRVVYDNKFTYLKDCTEILLNGASKRMQTGDVGETVCYIATAQLDNWEIQYNQAPHEKVELEQVGRSTLHTGDIVMNRINSVERLGRCGIVASEPEQISVFGQNTVRIRADEERIDPFFLFTWMIHPYVKQYVQQNSKNSTSFQSSLNKRVLTELPVPEVNLTRQREFAEELRGYFVYIKTARQINETLKELRQIWYDKIRFLLQTGMEESEFLNNSSQYEKENYWITPSGVECFYDSELRCIQVPGGEKRTLSLSQLPMEVEIQFLEDVRNASDPAYGSLDHIRLNRIGIDSVQVIRMKPVDYGSGRDESGDNVEQQLEKDGILSDQQDFGYIRERREVPFYSAEMVEQFMKRQPQQHETVYSRFLKLPAAARAYISRLSAFQQVVYEEFLLAIQPLAAHVVSKQVTFRAGKHRFAGYGIQDVIAAIQLLENAGLLEKRQGLYLDYYEDYKQGEERRIILDHRMRPIAMDTWICAEVRGKMVCD